MPVRGLLDHTEAKALEPPRSWILVVPSRDAIKTHLRVAKEVGYNKREQLLPPGLLF